MCSALNEEEGLVVRSVKSVVSAGDAIGYSRQPRRQRALLMQFAAKNFDLHMARAGRTGLSSDLFLPVETGILEAFGKRIRRFLSGPAALLPQFEPSLKAPAKLQRLAIFLATVSRAPSRLTAFAWSNVFQHEVVL